MTVLTHDCNVIKSHRTVSSDLKFYHISQTNHSHKDVFLRINLYIETFEDNEKINYDMFMSVALIQPPPTGFFTRQIRQRQNAVEDVSSSATSTYNNIF